MKKVYVIGSINQDIVVQTTHVAKPGETVFGNSLNYFPGGKGANQAVATKRLGGDVSFIGKVGTDAFGQEMQSYLEEQGLGEHIIKSEGETTGTALIFVDDLGENSITVIKGANDTLSFEDCEELHQAQEGDILLLQNEIPLVTAIELLHYAKGSGLQSVINVAPAAKLPPSALENIDIIIVNEHEFETCFGIAPILLDNRTEIQHQLEEISSQYELDVILTIGSAGVKAFLNGNFYEIDGIQVDAKDTTGAGDCFVGAFVAQQSIGKSELESLTFANAAAAKSVTRMGASASFPSIKEVEL